MAKKYNGGYIELGFADNGVFERTLSDKYPILRKYDKTAWKPVSKKRAIEIALWSGLAEDSAIVENMKKGTKEIALDYLCMLG